MDAPTKNNKDAEADAELPPAQEDSKFLVLGNNSRHQSFFPTIKARARNFARSLSGGYKGVRIEDFDDTGGSNKVAVDVRKEIQSVKRAFRDEVKEAKKGIEGDFLLEMTLTRTLSLMPSKKDMTDVADGFQEMGEALYRSMSTFRKKETMLEAETSITDPESSVSDEESSLLPKKEKKKTRKVPMHAYVTLLTAVTALSSIGPFLDRLVGVSPPLRIVWRQQGTALVLWPFALRSIMVNGPPKLSAAQWGTFVLASFSYCVLTVAFSMSVDYTTINDAAILTNSQSLLLVIAKLLIGSTVVFLEWSGVLVAFTGAFMCSRDSSEAVASMATTQQSPWLSLYGDSLALLSAVGGLGYIMLGKSLREHVEVYVFMTLNMLLGSHMILAYMWCAGDTWTFDRNIDHGVFGWANLEIDRLPVEFAVVFICNICGTMGYVRAFKYFSSVIIAVAALLEPVTATLLAIILRVGVFPGFLGCVGNVMVIVGTLMVIYPSAVEEEDDDEEQELGKADSEDTEEALSCPTD